MTPINDVISFFSRCLVPVVLWSALGLRGESTYASTNATTQYISRTWQTDEGLPLNAVQTIAQTRDGYLWVGTPRGLARFDGARFTVFDRRNTPELRDSCISAIHQARDGTLWIGTVGGLSYMRGGIFFYHKLGETARGNYIKCIFESRDGAFWVGTLDGLFCQRNGHWAQFTKKDGLPDDVVRSLCETDDQLYIGTGLGLCTWKDGKFKSMKIPGESDVPSIRVVTADAGGTVWVGMTEGLACIRKKEVRIYKKKDGLPDSNVTEVYRDALGNLWIGTYGGLCRFINGQFVAEKEEEGGFYDQVNEIVEDKEGDVWVGARDGLHELRPRRFLTYTRQQGLTHNNVMSVLEARDGSIWLGTWGGGLMRLKDKKFTVFNRENSEVSGMGSDLILSLFEDKDGSIFAGGDYEGGTFRYTEADGKFTRYWSKDQSLAHRSVRMIYRDHDGDLWFGTSPGLVLDRSDKQFLYDLEIRSMLEDHNGVMWVGSNRGLFQRTNGNFERFPLEGPPSDCMVRALHEDKEQRLWFTLDNYGLGLYQNGRVKFFTPQQGLWSDQIFEILEDDHGWLWMSSSKGVFRVNKSELANRAENHSAPIVCIAYGKADGMECIQCSGVSKPAAWRAHDGRFWFATSKGLVVTDPNADMALGEKPPPVMIEEVLVDKKPFVITAGSPLRISGGRGELEIHYTALSFQLPEKNQFRYRLSGADSDWVDAGTRRVAYYSNLRPGSYTFQVSACNDNGIWSEQPVEFGMTMLPHFWQLPWFSAVIAFAMAGVLGVTVRHATRRKLQRKVEGLEEQNAIEKERTRIAQDMHDDLGARLTEILLLNELARKNKDSSPTLENYLGKQLNVVRDVADSLDTIVWAVNPVNDSLDSLANYLCEQVERLLTMSSIRCRFDVPDQLPAQFVSSEVRHNIFLTVRESLNNCIKHSGASEVWFRIRHSPAALSIVIEDDGKGVSDNDRSACGNGLHNMELRMKTLGGSFRLSSRPGKGTQIHLEVPLRPFADERNRKQHKLN